MSGTSVIEIYIADTRRYLYKLAPGSITLAWLEATLVSQRPIATTFK